MVGNSPKGYRAPVYNITQELIDLLIERGFEYDSSLMGDDIPYIMETDKGSLAEIPVHWGTDDWPPFAHYEEIGYMMPVKAPSVGLNTFFEEFEAQYEARGMWHAIWHPFLTGRLARWKQVEKWLETVLESHDVWFATLVEISAHVKMISEQGDHEVRHDKLPYYTEPPAQVRK